MQHKNSEGRCAGSSFYPAVYLVLAGVTLLTLVVCVAAGSVQVPFGETVRIILRACLRQEQPQTAYTSIILASRLPRVLCVAFTGAALSISGAAMQGLLKNPLADGSTLGVSTGASLGAAVAIAFDITVPVLPLAGTMVMAVVFAFLSLVITLSIAWRMDRSLSTNTIILIGVVYAMFVNSILSLVVTFASDKVKNITFWTMGSLAGAGYNGAVILLVSLLAGGGIILRFAEELNAFSVGEDNARNIGVDVRHVRWIILVAISLLTGICVSVGGSIAFVGLVSPHIVRRITGPNHHRLLPAAAFGGATFLMLCDLVARTLLNPVQLPIGVVTSMVGAVLFIVIYYRGRRGAV